MREVGIIDGLGAQDGCGAQGGGQQYNSEEANTVPQKGHRDWCCSHFYKKLTNNNAAVSEAVKYRALSKCKCGNGTNLELCLDQLPLCRISCQLRNLQVISGTLPPSLTEVCQTALVRDKQLGWVAWLACSANIPMRTIVRLRHGATLKTCTMTVQTAADKEAHCIPWGPFILHPIHCIRQHSSLNVLYQESGEQSDAWQGRSRR